MLSRIKRKNKNIHSKEYHLIKKTKKYLVGLRAIIFENLKEMNNF